MLDVRRRAAIRNDQADGQSVVSREVNRDHAGVVGGRPQIDLLPLPRCLIFRSNGIVFAAGRESKNTQNREQENFPKCVGIHVRPHFRGIITLIESCPETGPGFEAADRSCNLLGMISYRVPIQLRPVKGHTAVS